MGTYNNTKSDANCHKPLTDIYVTILKLKKKRETVINVSVPSMEKNSVIFDAREATVTRK